MCRSTTIAWLAGVLAVTACSKGEDKPAVASSQDQPGQAARPGDPKPAPAAEPPSAAGVEPGGIQHDPAEGPAAVVTAIHGLAEVRRVGEAEFGAVKADAKLYPGDAIRTADAALATLTLADETVIEVAEATTVAIASRHGTADPASSAAVLAGLARFTVTSRAPGEGAFRVYTPGGVIVTRGTTYAVGVAASGAARVGVESGSVDVIGLAALDAAPIVVDAGAAATLDAKGTVAAPAPWPADDWGVWRDTAEATVQVGPAIDAHGQAMAELDAALVETYADLDASASVVASFEVAAAASADANDPAAYEAKLPDGAASIDASFAVAGRAEALTWAYASRAALAHEIYIRHTAEAGAHWTVIAPRVDAAVLWPKRYEVTATGYLEPLRVQYYVHHPRGRIHAPLVGVAVPVFYAKVTPPALDPDRVRARVKTRIWIAPEVRYAASTRPVWIAAPSADWGAHVKVRAAAPRANVAWYVRPPAMKAKLIVGAAPSGRYVTRLKIGAPAPRATLGAAWRIPVGVKIRIAPPDVAAAARARASFKVGIGGGVQVREHADATVRDHRDVVGAKVKVGVRVPDAAGAKVKVGVRVPDVAVKVREPAGAVRAHVKAGVGAAANVKVKVHAPAVKVKVQAPAVKVRGEAKGKIKLGL